MLQHLSLPYPSRLLEIYFSTYVSTLSIASQYGLIISTITCFWLKQLKDLQVFTVARVIFQLADEIPCISAVVVALLAEVHFYSF